MMSTRSIITTGIAIAIAVLGMLSMSMASSSACDGRPRWTHAALHAQTCDRVSAKHVSQTMAAPYLDLHQSAKRRQYLAMGPNPGGRYHEQTGGAAAGSDTPAQPGKERESLELERRQEVTKRCQALAGDDQVRCEGDLQGRPGNT